MKSLERQIRKELKWVQVQTLATVLAYLRGVSTRSAGGEVLDDEVIPFVEDMIARVRIGEE